MKPVYGFLSVFAASSCWAQPAVNVCVTAYTDNLRSHQVNHESSSFLSDLYEKVCDSQTRTSKSSLSIGLSAVVQQVPAAFNLGQGSAKESADHFCRTYNLKTDEHREMARYVSEVSETAAKGLESCIRAANEGVQLSVVTTVAGIFLTITPRAGSEHLVAIGAASDNLSCKTISFDLDSSSTTDVVRTFRPVHINCRRSPVNATSNDSGDDAVAYDRSELVVNVSPEPRDPIVIELPRSAFMSRVGAAEANAEISRLRGVVNRLTVSPAAKLENGARCIAAFDGLPGGRHRGLMNNTGYWLSWNRPLNKWHAVGANGSGGPATGTWETGAGGAPPMKAGRPSDGFFHIYDAIVKFDDQGKMTIDSHTVGTLLCPP